MIGKVQKYWTAFHLGSAVSLFLPPLSMVLKSFTDPCNDSTPFKASSTLIRTHWPYSRPWLSAPPHHLMPIISLTATIKCVSAKDHNYSLVRHSEWKETPWNVPYDPMCLYSCAVSKLLCVCDLFPCPALWSFCGDDKPSISFFFFFSFLMTWCQKGSLNYLESAWFAFQ